MGQEPATTEGVRFPCRQCGARLVFAPGTDSLTCPYCGQVNKIETAPDAPPVAEEDFAATLARVGREQEDTSVSLVKCQACAAEVTRPPNITSLSCPFCAMPIVLTEVVRRLIKPRSLLPFALDKGKAREAVRLWLRKLWFAPSALKKFASLEDGIKGMYIPAWTYDCEAFTNYTGQRGDAYYVTVTDTVYENGKPVQRTRQERRIRWTSVRGSVDNSFDDVLVIATRSLPVPKVRALEPWDLDKLVPYADAYLSGFIAEAYQVDLAEGFGVAQTYMQPTIETSIRRDIGGDEQRIDSMNTDWRDITFKHLLLPVWLAAYRFKNKLYHVMVNARTGEVQGERPWSWVKITLLVLMFAAAVGVIAFFASKP